MCAISYFAIRPLVKILDFPEAVVSAYVLILCFIGALSIRNNITDLWLIIGFGILGYGFERLKFPVAPLVLGVILGPIAEEAFMNTMISFSNDWTVFFTRPISGTIVALTVIVCCCRHTAFTEEPSGDGFESRLVSHAYQSWI